MDAVGIIAASSSAWSRRARTPARVGAEVATGSMSHCSAQRALKADLVAQQLGHLAGVERDVQVDELPGAPGGLGWRTQVRFSVDSDGRVGFRKYRSHDLQPVEHCRIASAGVEAAGVERHRWRGCRRSRSSRVTTRRVSCPSRVGPNARGLWPAIQAGLVVNGRVARKPERVTVDVLGRRFEVSAGVFWQVHRSAALTLGEVVLEGLGARPGDRVADLYTGVGLFAGLVGDVVGPDGFVLAVERDPEGVRRREEEHRSSASGGGYEGGCHSRSPCR